MRLRIATFNLENLDDGARFPPLVERLPVLRRRLGELAADVLCLQEVNAQQHGKHGARHLAALETLLAGTPYADFHRAATGHQDGRPFDVHNLVVLSRLPIRAARQLRHDLVPPAAYAPATADPAPTAAQPVEWDRPLLHAELDLGARSLHVLVLHLRAPLATPIAGQKESAGRWRSVAAWAEGFFISTMKRTGQAVETRLLVDRLYDAEAEPLIIVAGDLNASLHETPVRALIGAVEDTGNPELAERRLVALTEAVPAERRYSVLHGGRRVLLDHLLASPALARLCIGADILNAELQDEVVTARAGVRPTGSFHAGLVAEFAVSPG